MFDTPTMAHLSPDLLRTFAAAAETGSFTQAGKAVNRTQSAVSMQIKKLETDLDKPLFMREGRGVVLTADGQTLYRYTRRLLSLHDEALAAMSGPRLNGVVRFGAPDDYAAQYLPRVLKRFATAHPHVEVDVHCNASPDLREQLAHAALDVILTTDDPDGPGNPHRVELEWIVARQGGPLGQSPLPLALFHAGCLYRRNALTALEEAGIPYRVAYGSPSLAGVLAAVQAGLAVAPVTRITKAPGCRRDTPGDGLPPMAPVAIGLHRAPENGNEAIASFHDFIRDELSQSST